MSNDSQFAGWCADCALDGAPADHDDRIHDYPEATR
jgi:hypothetical protein